MKTVLDLFCGCGGFSLGFEQAGFNVKCAIDNWKGCQETFKYNHPNTEFILEDVTKLSPRDYKDIDIVIGSPPCQAFSKANNKKDPDKGMKLVWEFLRWIKEIKPKFWIMENVPDIEKYLKWRIIDFKIPIIKILNAANYGIPQVRKRCFAGKYYVPKITHIPYENGFTIDGQKLERWKTVWDAISNIIFIEPNQSNIEPRDYELKEPFLEKYGVLDLGKPSKQVTTKDDFALLPNHNIGDWQNSENFTNEAIKKKHPSLRLNEPSDTLVSRIWKDGNKLPNFRLEIPNHTCFDNCKDFNYESANREVNIKNPSATITSKNRTSKKLKILNAFNENNKSHKPINTLEEPNQTITSIVPSLIDNKKVYRRLSVRECARLQSFPDTFIFFGSLSSQYKMVGNAVPPLMAYALAKTLFEKGR